MINQTPNRKLSLALGLAILVLAAVALVVALSASTDTGTASARQASGHPNAVARASVAAETGAADPELQLTIVNYNKNYLKGHLDFAKGDQGAFKGGVVCGGSKKVRWGLLHPFGRFNTFGLLKVIGIRPDGCAHPRAVVELGAFTGFAAGRVEARIKVK